MASPSSMVIISRKLKLNPFHLTPKFITSFSFRSQEAQLATVSSVVVATKSGHRQPTLKPKLAQPYFSVHASITNPVWVYHTVKFRHNKGTPVSQLEYSRAIRCLMYAMINTRPDIAFAVGKLSMYTSNPSALHWQALGRVFQYLKGTIDYGLTYSGYPSIIKCYFDASWINNMEDHSSASGWVFLLGGGAISWALKKKTCITSSAMEYEFVALVAAGNEAEWLRNLVYEIPLWPKSISTISIRCDSVVTLAKAYSQVYNVSQLKYSRAIGCLMYAMISTRPDIAFAVGKLSRYTSNPSALHWQALGRVFQYLKGTIDYGLTYSGYPSVIEGYSDTSWINNMEDHSSVSGWVFLLGGAGNEVERLRNLVYEIPLCPKPISTISIRCDSAATLAKAYSQVYN
nr:zinc finger, CCHC-type [Tanacetum cinerariifolium]